MKIAFITNICTHYVAKLFELLGQHHNVHYYFTGGDESYWNKSNKPLISGIQARVLKGFTILPNVKVVPGLFGLFKGGAVVYIKTIDGRFALPIVFMTAKICRKPFILWTGIWSHPQTLFHKISFPFVKFIYKHSQAIVVYGEHVKKYLVQLGIKPEKIFCAPHSTDNANCNKPVSDEEISALRKRHKLGDRKIALYVGRFEECKGVRYFIESLSELKHTGVTAVLIGNGSQKEYYQDLCERSRIDYRIIDHVPNAKLYPYYALADVFVLPSVTTPEFKEPWGIVVNEAMNQGCPVIVTDAVGAAAGGLVENGTNGLIVPEKNPEALRGAIETLLKDDEQRKIMGQNARDKIRDWGPEQTLDGFLKAISYVSAS